MSRDVYENTVSITVLTVSEIDIFVSDLRSHGLRTGVSFSVFLLSGPKRLLLVFRFSHDIDHLLAAMWLICNGLLF